jgi:4-amino-4-deoxychorismate lyase
MKAGYNGTVVDADKAVISVYDHGFLYGMGLFETFRTYGGRPYMLDRHLERLKEGCRELGIRFDMEEEEVRSWIAEVMAGNGLADAYVRLTVSAGEAGLGLPADDYGQPNAIVLVKPLQVPEEREYLAGRTLRLLRTARNTPEGVRRLKSLHYMNNIIARRELAASGAAAGTEGLMLTREGMLAEGIVSNLFFVRDGVVCTPAVETGILPGITRHRVLELAESAGCRTEEGLYRWSDLLAASEIWTTGSVQELMPITTLVDAEGMSRKVGSGEAGPVALRLLALYRQDARQASGD